jgi:hypothetical protein
MRLTWVCFVALTILAVSTPIASAATAEHAVVGTVVLNDGFGKEGAPCSGSGKYADIKPGAKVTLKDAHKKTLGAGTLGEGTWTAAITGSDFVQCELPFSLSVPSSRSYAVSVAKRKAGNVSQKALAANDWTLTVTIA